jgi:hypothetical protein
MSRKKNHAGALWQERGNICMSFVSTERNHELEHECSVKREATCRSFVSKRGNIQEPKMMNLCD